MACGLPKVSDPSLTATFIEPYLKSGTDNFESTVCQVLPAYSVDSIKTGLQNLREHRESLVAYDDPGPVRRNGFVFSMREFHLFFPVVGNGLLTILMHMYRLIEKDKYELTYFDHATKEMTSLGYFPTYGWRTKTRGCMQRTPRLLCGLTQDGNYVVLLGPLRYTHSKFSGITGTPVIAFYQLVPTVKLLKKCLKNTNTLFIKSNPIGIAISRPSIVQRQYQVALLTYKMAVILFNMVALEPSILRLESVEPQRSVNQTFDNKNYLTFSPDGRFLTVFCYMQNESMNACLLIDVNTLEPLFWMSADEGCSWLRWLFPMFSVCGTKLVLSTYSENENIYDESKYELLFYKISGIQSLKDLCRVVILERVRPTLIDQLPLPQNMIAFLGSDRPTQRSENMEPSRLRSDQSTTGCRCNLL